MLNNINHEFVSEAPFLIEDRLKDLFANFLTDLSGTMDSIPGSLLEKCVSRLNSTISASVKDLVRSEILPSLFQTVMLHVSEFAPPPNIATVNISDTLTDCLDSLQDTM
jgi:hypothetical protein